VGLVCAKFPPKKRGQFLFPPFYWFKIQIECVFSYRWCAFWHHFHIFESAIKCSRIFPEFFLSANFPFVIINSEIENRNGKNTKYINFLSF